MTKIPKGDIVSPIYLMIIWGGWKVFSSQGAIFVQAKNVEVNQGVLFSPS